MKYKNLNIVGLMTGTSMDGIDISLVSTNGIRLKRLNKNFFYKYSKKTRNFLLSVLDKDLNINLKRKKILDEIVTNEHYIALKNLNIVKNTDLIGFHGQTIFHDPQKKISIQLGDPKKLAKMMNKNVVFDFRSKDIEMGGQGAPLAPVYHKFIIKDFNLELPSCILNIGGVANITYWDGDSLIGFDTGPGNALMDDYVRANTNMYFDKDGILASQGTPDKKFIKKNLSHNYFSQMPPKSLDRNSFVNFYINLLRKNYSKQDTIATLAEFTIETIIKSVDYLPKKIKSILITGGGYRNNYLMQSLKKNLNVKFLDHNDLGIEPDFIESELIAFLAARSFYDLPFTFPSTTGASKDISGGKTYTYL